jgi:YHS domain-containing protein
MKSDTTWAAALLAGMILMTIPIAAQDASPQGKPAATQPAAAGKGAAATAPASPAVLCPVTGKPIDRSCVTRFRGKWVYCANPDAVKEFEKDPYKYSDGVQAQWAADKPLRVQVKCPVTGERPNPEIFVGQGVDAIFFASDDARQKWLKDSQPFQKRLEAQCYAYQTECPVGGGAIDPAVSRTVDDRIVYFCCDGCAAEFAKNKAEYLKQVDEQIRANKTAWLTQLLEQKLGPSAKQNK